MKPYPAGKCTYNLAPGFHPGERRKTNKKGVNRPLGLGVQDYATSASGRAPAGLKMQLFPDRQPSDSNQTMKTPKRPFAIFVGAALLAALTATSGCFLFVVGAGAGAGTVAFIDGKLKSSVDANFERTAQAANAAIPQMSFVKISEEKDALNDKIIARDAGDKRIEIDLENDGDKLTKVEIRFGVFGDQALSQAILDKIKADL
jgi:hypothetical protein